MVVHFDNHPRRLRNPSAHIATASNWSDAGTLHAPFVQAVVGLVAFSCCALASEPMTISAT
jgi:hypothetical protein